MKTTMISLLLLVLITPLYANDSILECTYTKLALFDPKGTGDVSIELASDNQRIIFAGLDTNVPKIKGNVGESPLKVIKRDASTLWLSEEPSLGGINLFTIFLDRKMFICSKQYLLPSGQPFGMMFMGHCK